MKNKKIFYIFEFVFLVFSLWFLALAPWRVIAQPPINQSLEEFRQITQYSQTDLVTIISRIIRIVLSFQGLILVLIIIIAGFKWMLSGGDEEKIKQAKTMIGSGIVGMIIVALSYTLANFLINSLTQIVR
jgi:hypothetical protein